MSLDLFLRFVERDGKRILQQRLTGGDWGDVPIEKEEPAVTITRTQLLQAYADVLKARNVKYMRVGGIDDVYPGDFQNGDIVELAKRLGLGD